MKTCEVLPPPFPLPHALDPARAQMLDCQDLPVSDICKMFRVPLSVVQPSFLRGQ